MNSQNAVVFILSKYSQNKTMGWKVLKHFIKLSIAESGDT